YVLAHRRGDDPIAHDDRAQLYRHKEQRCISGHVVHRRNLQMQASNRQSAVSFAAFATLPMRSYSSRMKRANSSGVEVVASEPLFSTACFISGVPSAFTTAALSFATTVAGVPRGTTMPPQPVD